MTVTKCNAVSGVVHNIIYYKRGLLAVSYTEEISLAPTNKYFRNTRDIFDTPIT